MVTVDILFMKSFDNKVIKSFFSVLAFTGLFASYVFHQLEIIFVYGVRPESNFIPIPTQYQL